MREKHHFLYYIFQNDKNQCMMEEKKANRLQNWLRNLFRKMQEGENYDK